MKTKISTLISLLLILGISATFASKPAAESIYQKFKSSVQYPEKAVKLGLEGYVDVLFTVSDEGEILIKKITSSEPELEKMVKEQLKEININGIEGLYNEHFKVRFDFKLI